MARIVLKFGGTSVTHLYKISDSLGIGSEVRKKSVNSTGGNDAVEKVAKGEAEIAVVLVSEIHDKLGTPGAPWFAVSPLMHAAGMWTAFAAVLNGGAASGSQRWNGHIGTFTANANMNPPNIRFITAGLMTN